MAKPQSSKWSTAHACQVLKLCLVLAEGLGTIASLRLIESNVCRNYYREHNASAIDAHDHVSETLCKVTDVQRIVAQVNGLLSGLTSFPALFAAFPFLALHRLMNQKKLLLLNVFGILLENLYFAVVLYFYNTFDPRAIAFYGFFSFVGGGYPVFDSILQAKIAETVPQSSLSTFQLQYTAASLLVKITGTSLGLSLMKKSLWLPVTLMLCVHCIMIPVAYFFFGNPTPQQSLSDSTLHLIRNRDEDDTSSSASEVGLDEPPPLQSTKTSLIWNAIRQCRNVFLDALLPVSVIWFYDIANSFRRTMPYWMSRRYHWELRDVGWVQLGETLWTALIVALLPRFAKRFLEDRKDSIDKQTLSSTGLAEQPHPEHDFDQDEQIMSNPSSPVASSQSHLPPQSAPTLRDLRLTKFCILISALGTFILGFSWHRVFAIISLLILSGGYGFRDAYYSFLASQISAYKDHETPDSNRPETNRAVTDLGTVYMVLSFVNMLAYNLGGWLVSLIDAFALGVGSDGSDIGGGTTSATSLPVWFSTVSFLIAWWLARRSVIRTR